MAFNYCNDAGAVAFVKQYIADCKSVTGDDALAEYVLALAASETGYGRVGSFVQYNNFFSMESKSDSPNIKNAIGYVVASGTKNDKHPVKVAKFKSFAECCDSFFSRYGAGLKGATTAEEFAQRLIRAGFNSGKKEDGGDPNFAPKLKSTINAVHERLACK